MTKLTALGMKKNLNCKEEIAHQSLMTKRTVYMAQMKASSSHDYLTARLLFVTAQLLFPESVDARSLYLRYRASASLIKP